MTEVIEYSTVTYSSTAVLQYCSPNSYIHMSVSDLYILRMGHIFGCSKIDRPILEIYKSLTDI